MILASEANTRERRARRIDRRTKGIELLLVEVAGAVADRVHRAQLVSVEEQRLIGAAVADDFADLAVAGVEAEKVAFAVGGKKFRCSRLTL